MASQDHAPPITAVKSAQPHTPGPYWLNHTEAGIYVCGRHGKILFRFTHAQETLAQAQAVALREREVSAVAVEHRRQGAIRNAASDMLEALKGAQHIAGLIRELDDCRPGERVGLETELEAIEEAISAAIAKAEAK